MKKFIEKNKGVIIASAMVGGMAIGFTGLDWEQSQIAWRAAQSTWLMVVGSILFFGGVGWLLAASSNKSK